MIREAAESISITERALELQVLLYLPRLMREYGNPFPGDHAFFDEIRRLLHLIKSRVNPYAHWQDEPETPLNNLHATRFVEIPEREARIIHESFHFLSSFRPDSRSFGLRTLDENRLASLITISPFDLEHITPLPEGVSRSNVLVVSRVFCFDWVPMNTVSYMMGHMYRHLRLIYPNVQLLLTYINPNLAFMGSSLKAANWVLFGYEQGTRYAYIDKEYTTDRELVRYHRTADPSQLQSMLGDRFEVTRVRLDPLQLYAYFLDKELYARYSQGFEFVFERP